MKIIAVIVEGELPVNCAHCEKVTIRRNCSIIWDSVEDAFRYNNRPEWCPLRLEWDNARIARGVM